MGQNNDKKKYFVLIFDGYSLEPSKQLHRLFKSKNYVLGDEKEFDFIIVNIYSPKQLIIAEHIRKLFKCLADKYIKNFYKPIIFTTQLIGFENYFPYNKLLGFENLTEKINYLKSKNPYLSALINPNVWVRFYDLSELRNNFDTCVDFTKSFKEIYTIPSAKEVYEHFIRIQSENHLVSSQNDHAKHITPTIFHDELECCDTILSINTELEKTEYKYPEISEFKNITFRILLIDDKVEKDDKDDKDDKDGKNTQIKQSKAHLIKEIMSGNLLLEHAEQKKNKLTEKFNNDNVAELPFFCDVNYKKEMFVKDRLLWNEDISCYFYPTDTIKCFISGNQKTQIIQVTNLTEAILLLADESVCFDLILLDYLLGPKYPDGNDKNDRELSTAFFVWFQDKHGENKSVDYLRLQLYNSQVKKSNVKIIIKEKVDNDVLEYNKKLLKQIKFNSGTLRKLWIFPITAFNQTLIDDLTNNNVRLIDYYWHISKGADPITTPFLFLRMLNSFLYLQLEEAVFSEKDFRGFVEKNLSFIENLKDQGKIEFNKFSALMGAEYSKFVNDFINRPLIYNDKDTSLFSNYIWMKFMGEEKNEDLFLAVQAYQKFMHRCAFGSKAEYKKMKAFWDEAVFRMEQLDSVKSGVFFKMNSLLNDLTFS